MRDLPLLKTPEGTILVSQRTGIRGMSDEMVSARIYPVSTRTRDVLPLNISTARGAPMQLVLAYVCVAMAIGVFVMGIIVFWLIIKRALMREYLAKLDTIGLCIAMILGGGLIWLGLHYGFEPVQDKLAVASQSVPKQSSACNTDKAKYGLIIDAGSSGSRIYIYCWTPAGVNGIPWVIAARAQAGEPPWIEKDDTKPLSAVSSDMDAEKSLKFLIEYAIKKIGNDPQTLKEIPLDVMATAGMRLLEDKDEKKRTILR
jgi:hypothetical protein